MPIQILLADDHGVLLAGMRALLESELLNAIRAVQRGEVTVHPTIMRTLLKAPVREPAIKKDPSGVSLTPREVEVLRFIARGFKNRQIAENLKLSVRTIESHRANLMGKLEMETRIQLVLYSTEHKLLD
jgi:DNA-binding NarL/FixJ family response regulator